ncbi:MAG: hypothetical protein MUE35_00330 [Hydrogenophaga sp.]|jgi:hypothetical protein|nr:hypothetical protein [Hydrogenophaga sp.]
MRFRRKDPALPRLAFEARSVQLVAAWTLAMAGMSATHLPAPSRHGGGASSHVGVQAPANALPPLTASLPRK